ncbi:hypothetical protein E4U53_004083 [Claviceps sorghi]|nr:hypothetical protein E4U53_004083 [Claviceps sorghi]
MAMQSSILMPPDRSKNPVEKLACELLCREYRARHPRLSPTEKTEFRRVLQRIVVTRSMTTVSRHTLADHLGLTRLPNVAEFELLAILYGVRGCSRCHWFAAYAAEHPDALEPRFRGIIVQIDKPDWLRILRKRQPLPHMSMDKVPFESGAASQRGRPAMRRCSDPVSPAIATPQGGWHWCPRRVRLVKERSAAEPAPSRGSTSSRQSSASSASSGSVPAMPAPASAPAPAAVGADGDDRSNRTAAEGSRVYVEETLAPLDGVVGTCTGKTPADLAQVIAELRSREAYNTMAVDRMHHALEQLRERLVALGHSLHSIETRNHQMGREVNSLGISHYTLRQEQTELQRRHAQLCEAVRSSVV